ncbi:hypothetical protein Hanom_Chr13g01209881 [Helianthus anomalus]
MVKNFVLPKDADLEAQPSAGAGKFLFCIFHVILKYDFLWICELINLSICPEINKKKHRHVASTTPRKIDAPKADISKEEKKKVVSDPLEGLAPIAMKQPKVDPRDTADIPVSNPDDPIDVESSPESLVRTKADKRKKPEGEAAVQPTKKISRKKISKKGHLDTFDAKFSLDECLFSSFHHSNIIR